MITTPRKFEWSPTGSHVQKWFEGCPNDFNDAQTFRIMTRFLLTDIPEVEKLMSAVGPEDVAYPEMEQTLVELNSLVDDCKATMLTNTGIAFDG